MSCGSVQRAKGGFDHTYLRPPSLSAFIIGEEDTVCKCAILRCCRCQASLPNCFFNSERVSMSLNSASVRIGYPFSARSLFPSSRSVERMRVSNCSSSSSLVLLSLMSKLLCKFLILSTRQTGISLPTILPSYFITLMTCTSSFLSNIVVCYDIILPLPAHTVSVPVRLLQFHLPGIPHRRSAM